MFLLLCTDRKRFDRYCFVFVIRWELRDEYDIDITVLLMYRMFLVTL